ncbi:D-glucuronyl C5-epimerase family protein [Bradyrhizobium sp. B124]|uniref:D-glucuronyl C5-epimerase family protein n=1 Tax=Bradyrhizobium sp. B124 TaxID=3140245 RepID=UPI003182FB8D
MRYLDRIVGGLALCGLAAGVYQLRQQNVALVAAMAEMKKPAPAAAPAPAPAKPILLSRDPYLGLSNVTSPDPGSYQPQFVQRVRYVGAGGTMLRTEQLSPADHPVIWSEAYPVVVGDEFDVVDDEFHDLRAGSTFVKVRRIRDQFVGYLPLQAFVAETVPSESIDNVMGSIDGHRVMLIFGGSPTTAIDTAKAIDGKALASVYSAPISKGAIHPVTAGNHLASMLLGLGLPHIDEATRETTLAAARRVFDEYIFPAKIEIRPGVAAWPNTYDFPIPWNAKMKAPWFSGYSNGVIANAAAVMFRLTGEDRYAELARAAVAWMKLPAADGGALYQDGAGMFVAEYPSDAPTVPNIGVLDGEMIAALAVYNTAALLEDDQMMRFAAQLAYSLVNKTDQCTTADGRINNARYQWLITTDSYITPMKRWAVQLGIITKDRRMLAHAENWRISDVYWPGN